ncbi:unnamed protein product, partial [Polarella glacialis]
EKLSRLGGDVAHALELLQVLPNQRVKGRPVTRGDSGGRPVFSLQVLRPDSAPAASIAVSARPDSVPQLQINRPATAGILKSNSSNSQF